MGRFPLACLIVLVMLAATLLPVSHAYLHLHGGGEGAADSALGVSATPQAPESADDPPPSAPRTHADHCPLCLHLAQPLLPTAGIPGFKVVERQRVLPVSFASSLPTGRLAWLRPASRAPPASFS